MATTIYKISEEILKALSGGAIQAATSISMSEIKISVCQVVNQLLKVEQFNVNEKVLGEIIPNGTVVASYEGIVPYAWITGRSKADIPVKPLKLRRNMGIFSVFFTDDPDNEFIPLQMGQRSLLKSQPQINDLLGQIGYENKSLELQFTKDLVSLFPSKTLTVELLLMDVSLYDDYDPLPILPEQEWTVKQEVIKLYSGVGIADMVVDPLSKQLQNIPAPQQKQPS
jgi:hypothetical protein